MTVTSRMLGATITAGGVRFAVWVPKAARVEVELHKHDDLIYHPLERTDDGLHTGTIPAVSVGARYKFRLDGEGSFPDPWSRFQPEGVHGPSEVIAPSTFTWT